MDEGGFLVNIDGKISFRCYKVEFDYDEYQYVVNGTEKHEFPSCVKKINIKVEG